MKTINLPIILVFLMLLMGCVSESDLDAPNIEDVSDATDDDTDNDDNSVLASFDVPDDFSYNTSKNLNISLRAPDFLKNAVFDLYAKVADEDSVAIGRGTFDDNGLFEREFTASSLVDSVLIFTDYIGLTDNIRLPVENNAINFDYRPLYERDGGSGKGYKKKPERKGFSMTAKADYTYIDTYDSNGVPENLAFPDVIQQNLLDDVNASLPEGYNGGIPVTHPEYLADTETNIILTQEADVWVTFVSEGAGYRNVLGYYSYPIGEEPESVDDIVEHKVVFPNVSMSGSGGGLIPGDRVYLGRFPANTVISWFLASNGWNGSSVSDGKGLYYSNSDFNPESTEANRRHMVLLNDEARELNILGFEDLFRDGGSDDDFNDAVFYAKANPPEAIQVGNLAKITASNDSDGDGINDELDDFPFDVNKAFNNFGSSANSSGKLVYEDLWPSQGDYDFNDLVIDYSFNLIANSDNLITAIDGEFTVEHIGASFHNGFAFVLPIDPSLVESIEGQLLNGDYEDVASNGVENGTLSDESVIIVAGDTFGMTGETVSISIEFNTAIVAETLGAVPFNAFLIANADRQREVHLPDFAPTSKASYLGTSDDYSDGNMGRYYKSSENLPWALNIYGDFVAPPESVPISLQYPRFVNWANSGGTQDRDWYVR
ncbi:MULTISPECIES: LruC domain-containing protein [Flavobacteriaceae]|uniref:LruC domain-containing protein n=1 Tax=Flavobacteriaceae TaxID=49546 RepID=UPI0014914981|nr:MULTISPECIES: LruC domain-containing protein [Allomuricauda]MDC6365642.1 LruC domain-containing protein [Muricauda sp. AC10]